MVTSIKNITKGLLFSLYKPSLCTRVEASIRRHKRAKPLNYTEDKKACHVVFYSIY